MGKVAPPVLCENFLAFFMMQGVVYGKMEYLVNGIWDFKVS